MNSMNLFKSIKQLFYVAIVTLIGVPTAAMAHVKWFAEEEIAVEPFSLFEPAVLVWIVVVAALIAAAVWTERHTKPLEFITKLGQDKFSTVYTVGLVLIALWPVITALQGHVLVPTVELNTVWSVVGLVMLVVGITTVIPHAYSRRVAGVGFIGLWLYLATQLGLAPAVEHIFIVGIGVMLLLVPTTTKQFIGQPLWIVRTFTGISLVVLAFQEKLLNPGLSQQFLVDYPYFNFMSYVGITAFTDRLFILSSGMVELLIGILIMVGISTRITTAVLGGVFVSTAIVLGPQEVIGHLPLFGVAVFLLVYGNGKK